MCFRHSHNIYKIQAQRKYLNNDMNIPRCITSYPSHTTYLQMFFISANRAITRFGTIHFKLFDALKREFKVKFLHVSSYGLVKFYVPMILFCSKCINE